MEILWFFNSRHTHLIDTLKHSILKIDSCDQKEVQNAVLYRIYKQCILIQIISFLLILAHRCIRYNGFKNIEFENILDCFRISSIPPWKRGVEQASLTLDTTETQPTVDDVVEVLLTKQKGYFLRQFTRALCIPSSRESSAKKVSNEYEIICQKYRNVLRDLILKSMEIIPKSIIDGSYTTNQCRWIKISKPKDNSPIPTSEPKDIPSCSTLELATAYSTLNPIKERPLLKKQRTNDE